MLTMALVAVAVPALAGIVLFLLPRSPWVAVGPHVHEGRRVVPGTAALSLGAALALSVWLQEGTTAPWAKWHTVPFVIAGFALLSLVRGSHERPIDGLVGCVFAPFMATDAATAARFDALSIETSQLATPTRKPTPRRSKYTRS